jgi:hypothetical protein
MPPEEETANGPALAVACERSFSAWPVAFLLSPWTYDRLACEMGKRMRYRKTYLVSSVASQRADSALYCAGGLVDVALEGGGLVLVVGRHRNYLLTEI